MSRDYEDFDPLYGRAASKIEVECRHCGQFFAAPTSLRSGLANCPHCRRATPVPGGPEPLFWLLLGGGIVMALGLSALFGFTIGPIAGVVTLAVCAVIIVVAVLAS